MLSGVDELTESQQALSATPIRLLSSTAKCRQPMCVGLVDRDHFNAINDTFWHEVDVRQSAISPGTVRRH